MAWVISLHFMPGSRVAWLVCIQTVTAIPDALSEVLRFDRIPLLHYDEPVGPNKFAYVLLVFVLLVGSTALAQKSPVWALGRSPAGKLEVDSKSNLGTITFEYENSSKKIFTGFPIGHNIPDVANLLYFNVSLDGYGGLPVGSCLKRAELLAHGDPTKPICLANQNQDLLRVWSNPGNALKNVLIKNVDIKNAFRSYNAVDGIVVKSSNELPHTDTFQSYFGGDSPHNPNWLVFQDTIIKNSDNSLMIVGDTKWKGFVYQNLVVPGCEAGFLTDARARVANDYQQYQPAFMPAGPSYHCSHAMHIGTYYSVPAWLVEVNPAGGSVAVYNQNGPIIVVGSNSSTLVITGSGTSTICRYRYLEDALTDSNTSDRCGNFSKPPFLELSCAGWRTPPPNCTTQAGSYIGKGLTYPELPSSVPAPRNLHISHLVARTAG